MLAEISDEWGWTRPSVEVGRLALIMSVVSCAPSSDDRGQFLWEYWVGIGGDAIADLTSHPDYPDNPSGRRLFGRLETPRQFEDHYGARLRGFLHPPVSGEYSFELSSRAGAELWLTRDDRPDNKVRLAAVAGDRSARRRSKSERRARSGQALLRRRNSQGRCGGIT